MSRIHNGFYLLYDGRSPLYYWFGSNRLLDAIGEAGRCPAKFK